jgi:hypothetical protein
MSAARAAAIIPASAFSRTNGRVGQLEMSLSVLRG